MDSSSSQSCLFLTMLPLEIRLEIYHYLLGRHTKHEHDMKSAEYDWHRGSILNGPDHSYHFHPSILGANQQIREEAMNIFLMENTFVSVTHDTGEIYPFSFDDTLHKCGAVEIAGSHPDHRFPFVGMSVKLNTGISKRWVAIAVITADDLPAACVFLQRKINDSIQEGRSAQLAFTISPDIETVAWLWDEAWPVPGTQYSKCMEPLRQLRGASHVTITEDRNACDTATLAIGDPQLSAKETMDLVASYAENGDHYFFADAFRPSIEEYRTCIRIIQSCAFKEDELGERMVCRRFEGLSAREARDSANVCLHFMIAASFFQLKKYRLARIYVERIYGPLYSCDDRGNRQKFPLEITAGGHAYYAELLALAAEISFANGDKPTAHEELTYASSLDPLNMDISRRLEEFTRIWDDRRNRRRAKQRQQRRSHKRRLLEMIEVARRRKIKGDEAVRKHDLSLAQKEYETAYKRLKGLPIDGWNVRREKDNLVIEIASMMITVALKLENHKAVHRWADLIIRQDLTFKEAYERWDRLAWDDNHTDAADCKNEAGFIAHYGKAVALQKRGRVTAAIGEFEWALECDRSCHATYYQLETLKQKKADFDRMQDKTDQQLKKGWLEGEKSEAEESEAEESGAEESEAEESGAEENEAQDRKTENE